MNNIEILEEFIKYFEAEATQRKYRRNISITVGEDDIEAIENLIQENKELKEVLEKISKDLDNIAYDQIPIEMQRAFGKEYDLGYRQGWYNAEEDWKLKVKEKIEELEKLQENNRKDLEKYINVFNFHKIDEISNKIMENYRIKTTLQELLEEGE